MIRYVIAVAMTLILVEVLKLMLYVCMDCMYRRGKRTCLTVWCDSDQGLFSMSRKAQGWTFSVSQNNIIILQLVLTKHCIYLFLLPL